jgi:hypothetical protein
MIGTVGNISLVLDADIQYAIKNVGLFKVLYEKIYIVI